MSNMRKYTLNVSQHIYSGLNTDLIQFVDRWMQARELEYFCIPSCVKVDGDFREVWSQITVIGDVSLEPMLQNLVTKVEIYHDSLCVLSNKYNSSHIPVVELLVEEIEVVYSNMTERGGK